MNADSGFPDEVRDCAGDAALYVLGALTPDNAGAFELRLRSGCPYCAKQAEQFASVAEQLPLALNPVAARPELRQRLLDRIQDQPRPGKASEASKRLKLVRNGEGSWRQMPFPGVEVRRLFGSKTMMLRMQAGAVFPGHDHPSAEQCYVLEGTVTDSDGLTLGVGDFVVMSGGAQHAPLHSETGCTLLIAYGA